MSFALVEDTVYQHERHADIITFSDHLSRKKTKSPSNTRVHQFASCRAYSIDVGTSKDGYFEPLASSSVATLSLVSVILYTVGRLSASGLPPKMVISISFDQVVSAARVTAPISSVAASCSSSTLKFLVSMEQATTSPLLD